MTPQKANKVTVEIELDTEVIRLNQDLFTQASYVQEEGLILHLDVRKRNWPETLALPCGTKVRFSRVHTVDIKELSSFLKPITYRLTIGEPYWMDQAGQRHDFGLDEYLPGIDLKRGVTTVTLRAAVLLAVLAGVGLRSVVWLLQELFHVEVSKSSLDRWLEEAACHLPDAEGMVKRLIADRAVREAHLDEIFPKGQKKKPCVLVLKDEHGRLLAQEELPERTTEQVKKFLQKLRGWGLDFKTFYLDGCQAYKEAIPLVFPAATIPYDYFHIIQNIWRHLRQITLSLRRQIKAEAEEALEPESEGWLKGLADRLWKHRALLFKNEERMSAEERQTLQELMSDADEVSVLRRFLAKVWGIFRDSKGKQGARQRLANLRRRPEVVRNSAYEKAVKFLEDRFDDMIAFLHVEGVQRNSLAESGIRCLRRLERGHDGFRGTAGRDKYLRLYQAIRYCGWSVHRGDGLLKLPEKPAVPAVS